MLFVSIAKDSIRDVYHLKAYTLQEKEKCMCFIGKSSKHSFKQNEKKILLEMIII